MNTDTGRRLTPIPQPQESTKRHRKIRPHDGRVEPVVSAAEAEVDLLQLMGVVWRGKLAILFFSLVALLAGGYYLFELAVPKYLATSRLVLQPRSPQVFELDSIVSGFSTEQAAINTELEVIRSRELIEQLVGELSLVDDPEFNSTLRDPPWYSPSQIWKKIGEKTLGKEAEPETEPDPELVKLRVENAVSNAIRVSSRRNTYLFDIQVTTEDPYKSALIANRLAELYIDDQIENKFQVVEYAVNWLANRVTQLEAELRQKDDAIKELRSETQLVSVQALESLNLRAKDIRERLASANDDFLRAVADRDNFQDMITSGDHTAAAAMLGDPLLERLAERARQGDETAQQEIAVRIEEMASEKKQAVERARSLREVLQRSYEKIEQQISEQNADLQKLTLLKREADATRVLYETFLARLKEASLQTGIQQADSRILSAAVPGALVSPRILVTMAISLGLGGLVGIVYVLLRYKLAMGFRTASELEKMTGYTVLGQIPITPVKRRSGLLKYLRSRPTSAFSEAIRNLRTSILMSNPAAPPKVIAITSSIPAEGKTTLAVALASNLAGLNKKVLLVEGDIRRKTFSSYFGKPKGGDLIDVIAGRMNCEEAVKRVPEMGIDVLMARNAAELDVDIFSSDKFDRFIDEVRSKYDFVILDTPPVILVPDARLIGHVADAVIYVVKWDYTPKEVVQEGLKLFSSVGIPVTGITLSQIDPSRSKRYGLKGHYGYGLKYYNP